VLNYLGLDRSGLLPHILEVESEFFGNFFAHEPLKGSSAGPEKRRILLHFFHLELDHLLVGDCDALILVLICRFRTRLNNNLGVIHVHHL